VSPRGVTKGLLRISDGDYDHYASANLGNYGNDNNYGDANTATNFGSGANGPSRRGSGGTRDAPAARPGAAQRALAQPPLMEEDYNEVCFSFISFFVFLWRLQFSFLVLPSEFLA